MPTDFGTADSLISIDLDAIVANWHNLNNLSASACETGAVVKADCYGLGVRIIAPRLAAAGCRTFFVMSIDEGSELRESLAAADQHEAHIYCLGGMQRGQEDAFLHYALIPVINTLEQLARVSMLARRAEIKMPAAIHIDTGMARLGLTHTDTDWLIEHMSDGNDALAGIDLRYLMSHLANADDPAHPSNAKQAAAMWELRGFFPATRASLANSGGIFLGPSHHFNLTRPGIALYGIHPCAPLPPDTGSPLQSALQWDARILQIRHETAGTPVGYGSSFVTARDSVLVTVGVGYADGYPRNLGNKASVMISGHRAPIVGRVSMDSMTIDVTDLPDGVVAQCDRVTVLGGDLCPAEIATLADTIPYELLTGLGQRPKRVYHHSGTEAEAISL